MDVRAVQARLRALGFDPGPVDGVIGHRTYGALFAAVADRQLGERGLELGRGAARWFGEYEISTTLRLAHFLGQTAHESGGFRWLEEQGGPTYFHRMYDKGGNRPQVAADLGNTERGDGARYHGRGIIQLTGRANYREAGERTGLNLEADPALAAVPAHAVLLACDYWRRRGINRHADADDLAAVTRSINGGLRGLEERRRFTTRAKAVLR